MPWNIGRHAFGYFPCVVGDLSLNRLTVLAFYPRPQNRRRRQNALPTDAQLAGHPARLENEPAEGILGVRGGEAA